LIVGQLLDKHPKAFNKPSKLSFVLNEKTKSVNRVVSSSLTL